LALNKREGGRKGRGGWEGMRGREGLHDERPFSHFLFWCRGVGCGKEKVPKQGVERARVKKRERDRTKTRRKKAQGTE